MVELPAELADEVHAQRMRRAVTHADLLARQPGECLVREISVGELLQHLARIRTGEHQHAEARGDGVKANRSIGRTELPQIVMVVALIGTSGDEIEATRRPLKDGKLRTHAAARGELMAKCDAAHLLRDLVGENGLEPFTGTRARHFHLGEGRHVLDGDIAHHVPAFLAHEGEIVGTAERPLLDDAAIIGRRGVVVVGEHVGTRELLLGKGIALGCEPAWALPAIDGAEHGTEILHAVIDRRTLQRAGGGALLVRIVRGEDIGVGFLVLGLEVATGGVGAETAGVHAHHVDRRLALDDPFRELPAGAARGGDAEGMALVQPEVLPVPGGTDDR